MRGVLQIKKKPFEYKINKEREDERKIKVEMTMNEPIQSYLGWVGQSD